MVLLLTQTPWEWFNTYVHSLAWPVVVGVVCWFCWSARGVLDRAVKNIENDRAIATSTKAITVDVQAALAVIRDNHLTHLAADMVEQSKKQDAVVGILQEQTKILTSMDKYLAIISDRTRGPNS